MKRVVIRHVPEPAAQRLLIEKGDTDVALNLTGDQVTSLKGNEDVTITPSPQPVSGRRCASSVRSDATTSATRS